MSLEKLRAGSLITADQYTAGAKLRHHYARRYIEFHDARAVDAVRAVWPICRDSLQRTICSLRPINNANGHCSAER
jgi:hypothetical protein